MKKPREDRTPARWPIILTAIGTGIGCLVGALWVFSFGGTGPVAIWGANSLVTIGGAILLVIPFEWITGRLSRRVEEVHDEVGDVRQDATDAVNAAVEEVRTIEQETRQSVADVREEVEAVNRRVSSLAEFADRAAESIQQERDADDSAYGALAESEPTRERVIDAMRRAATRGVVSDRHGVRAQMHPGLADYVRLQYTPGSDQDEERLDFTLVETDGHWISTVPWVEGESAVDVMQLLSRALSAAGREGGLNAQALQHWWSTIAKTLAVGASHPERHGIIELCPSQWAVTDTGVVPYPDHPLRGLGPRSLRNPRSVNAAKDWPWVNEDSLDDAAMVWLALFGEEDPFGL